MDIKTTNVIIIKTQVEITNLDKENIHTSTDIYSTIKDIGLKKKLYRV